MSCYTDVVVPQFNRPFVLEVEANERQVAYCSRKAAASGIGATEHEREYQNPMADVQSRVSLFNAQRNLEGALRPGSYDGSGFWFSWLKV